MNKFDFYVGAGFKPARTLRNEEFKPARTLKQKELKPAYSGKHANDNPQES
ncbi:MAG: hypothetical protein ABII93_00375 [Chrysiogenia bacterium]